MSSRQVSWLSAIIGAVIGAPALAIPTAFDFYKNAVGGPGCFDMGQDACGRFMVDFSLIFTIPIGGGAGALLGLLVVWIVRRYSGQVSR